MMEKSLRNSSLLGSYCLCTTSVFSFSFEDIKEKKKKEKERGKVEKGRRKDGKKKGRARGKKKIFHYMPCTVQSFPTLNIEKGFVFV